MDPKSLKEKRTTKQQKGIGVKKSIATKHQWTNSENKALVDCLVDLCHDPCWKGENGFKTGYSGHLEKMIKVKLPGTDIRANPHIESRTKLLKKQYHAISEMLNHTSGFGWNEDDHCVTCTKDVFDDWVRSHPSAHGLRNKPFPHYDELVEVFGKDRATGAGAETAADAIEELDEVGEETDFQDDEVGDDETEFGSAYGEGQMNNTGASADAASGSQATSKASSKKAGIVTSKKRKVRDDGLTNLVVEIGKFASSYQENTECLKSISSFFSKEAAESDRKLMIFEEIIKLEAFSKEEVMDAGEHILKDAHKLDTFYALPMAFRKDYVLKQLGDLAPYQPTFDF